MWLLHVSHAIFCNVWGLKLAAFRSQAGLLTSAPPLLFADVFLTCMASASSFSVLVGEAGLAHLSVILTLKLDMP